MNLSDEQSRYDGDRKVRQDEISYADNLLLDPLTPLPGSINIAETLRFIGSPHFFESVKRLAQNVMRSLAGNDSYPEFGVFTG